MSSTHKPTPSALPASPTLNTADDELTVLVFKDNSAARTFRVSLTWISRVGLIIGVVTAVAILGVFLSTRFFLTARQASKSGDPAYVQALETENASLKTSLKQAQTQPQIVPAQTQAPVPAQSTETAAQSAISTPVPTVTVTVTATPASATTAPVATAPMVAAALGPGFSALPSLITPDLSGSSISIYEPKIKWAGKTLKVQFFIQYNKEDKGNQQGRIILIARGAQTLSSYPADVFNTGDSPALIIPEKGEYFSVSRIREVKADFGPAKTTRDFNSVEVFLLSTDQKLLVHQFLKAPDQPVPPVKAPKPKATEDTPTANAPATSDTNTTPNETAPSQPSAQPLTPPTDAAQPPAAVSTPAAPASGTTSPGGATQ